MQNAVPVQPDQMVWSEVVAEDDFAVDDDNSLGNSAAAGAVFIIEAAGIDAGKTVIFCHHVGQLKSRLLDKLVRCPENDLLRIRNDQKLAFAGAFSDVDELDGFCLIGTGFPFFSRLLNMNERGVDAFGFKIFGADAFIFVQLFLCKKNIADPADGAGFPDGSGKHTSDRWGGAAFQDPDNSQQRDQKTEQRNAEDGKKAPDGMLFLIHSAFSSSLS